MQDVLDLSIFNTAQTLALWRQVAGFTGTAGVIARDEIYWMCVKHIQARKGCSRELARVWVERAAPWGQHRLMA